MAMLKKLYYIYFFGSGILSSPCRVYLRLHTVKVPFDLKSILPFYITSYKIINHIINYNLRFV